MPANHDVAVRLMVLLLPVLLYAVPAMSQGKSRIESRVGAEIGCWPRGAGRSSSAEGCRYSERAPKDAADEQRDKLDRELDAKLRICRDC